MDPVDALSRGVLFFAALVSFGTLVALARPDGRWGLELRRRFVLGVPWGTLLTVGLVLFVYLSLQGGLDHWYRPTTIPFRAWSYFYPLGVLTAGLSHVGPNHLVGNLLGTLVFSSLAEYAWSHFPHRRGAASFATWRSNPLLRIVAVPAVAVAVAVTSGLFGLGPVIGFSGVVFAFAGFALVRYPIAAVVLLAAGDLVRLTYRSLLDPVIAASGSVGYSTPWWADIAIQGHALGLFTGFGLAILCFGRRRELPTPGRVWLGVTAYGASQGLWAVYLFEGGDSYVLYRAAGLGLVFLLAALVTSAATASHRDLVARIDLSRREAAVGLLFAVLFALALAAVPYNLVAIDDVTPDERGVDVRDYTVFYAEDIEDEYVAAYDFPLSDADSVTTSGVIVASERRQVWHTAVSRDRLAFAGERTVRVGGLWWRDAVVANRTGWNVVGNQSVYAVRLRHDGTETFAFASNASRAEPTVAGRNVTFRPDEDGFTVVVSRQGETLAAKPLPPANVSIRAGGLTLRRNETRLFAERNGTSVRVATRERYGRR